MAANIVGRDTAATGFALGQGIRNAQERGETPSTFNYTAGSVGKFSDPKYGAPRYAGDVFRGKGMEGDFALALEDKKNEAVQKGMERFVSQWTNGPWSPFDMGPAPDQGGAPVETA